MTAPEMQLEFWLPKGRKGGTWIPTDDPRAGPLYRTWRKVKPGHTHKDKLSHSLRLTAGYAASRDVQCERYCQWARLAGLKRIHVFADDWRGINAAHRFAFTPIEVDPAEFIGPAPTPEICLPDGQSTLGESHD